MTKFTLMCVDNSIIYVTDEDSGATVTNNVERVLEATQKHKHHIFKKGTSSQKLIVLYQDTMGYIDEIKVSEDGKFDGFKHLDTQILNVACYKMAQHYELPSMSPSEVFYFDTIEIY